MPAASPRDTVIRQWTLLKLLPDGAPGKGTRELTAELCDQGYQVTKRTVERDLAALRQLFSITASEEDRTFQWRWSEGARRNISSLTSEEAMTLTLIQRFVEPVLPRALAARLARMIELAKKKLQDEAANNRIARLMAKTAVLPAAPPLMPPAVDAKVLHVLQEALATDEQVEVDYTRSDGKRFQQARLNPLGLVLNGTVLYLVASRAGKAGAEARTYAVHRMHTAKRLHTPAKPPDGVTLTSFIRDGGFQFGERKKILLRIRVGAQLAMQLRESRLSEDQTVVAQSEGAIVKASVLDSWRLRWWILSKGAEIEVIAPKKLREEIAGELTRAAAKYASAGEEKGI